MTVPAVDLDTVPDVAEELPRTLIGVEQEYKWEVDPAALFPRTPPSFDDLAAATPAPRHSEPVQRLRHRQSTIYFDDRWALTNNGATLRSTVNPGLARGVAWLGVKHTISWQDGCRDALEVTEKVDPRGIGAELRAQRTLPVSYATRLCGRPIEPTAYGYVIQDRHKLFFRTRDGFLLQLTFDIAEFHRQPRDEGRTTYWLEVESNNWDLRARHELNVWARELTDRLGRTPSHQAKSELAARMAGWGAD